MTETITLRLRRDHPSEAGLYLVVRAGCTTPETAHWSERDQIWRALGRRISVESWTGPIVQPRRRVEPML